MKKDMKIAILGYGVEGKSTEKYLLTHGFFDITILDEKKADTESKKIVGKEIWSRLVEFDLVFRTPGISPLLPPVHSLALAGKLTSQMELFFDLCPTKNIVGITGTKGKGTTSTLISEILKADGKDVYLGGNIGLPPMDFLDQLNTDSYVVLEMSSFQTFTLQKSPHIAVVLMVTQDHLDVHKDVDEYVEAKANLVKHQTENDVCIYNLDFPRSVYIAGKSKAKKISFSLKKDFVPRDFEVVCGDDVCSIVECEGKDNQFLYIKDGSIFYNQEKIVDLSSIALPGQHNVNNVMSAIGAALAFDVSLESIVNGISNFSGLPMHIETVLNHNLIRFVNDSFATTPETTMAGLQSFVGKNIAVMIGGSDKGSDYDELGKYIVEHENIYAVCYGMMKNKIVESIQKFGGQNFVLAESFEDAFFKAKNSLVNGGICLLSPACASFDLFANYKERGKKFNELVKNLI